MREETEKKCMTCIWRTKQKGTLHCINGKGVKPDDSCSLWEDSGHFGERKKK